jgi:hypothetical protein
MKRILMALNTVVLMTSLTVSADDALTPNLQRSLQEKAAESEKGVIMVLSGRGDVAADAAFLLVSQLKDNPGYAPLLLIAEQEKLQGYMRALALNQESLPAVVFFDKSGREQNRVIAAQPVEGATQRMMTAAIR